MNKKHFWLALVLLMILVSCTSAPSSSSTEAPKPATNTAPPPADTATTAPPEPTNTLPPPTVTNTPLPMGDGINWVKHPSNPVLDVGPEGAWDDTLVGEPRVLATEDGFHMIYVGFDGTRAGGGYSPFYGFGLGVATSTDAVTWVRQGSDPILSLSGSEFGMMHHGGAIQDDMYYTYYSLGSTRGGVTATRIYLATSPDGLTWTPNPDPVISPGPAGSYDSYDVFAPIVLVEEGMFKMWYTAMRSNYTTTIAYATSPDGIVWTKYEGNPVLEEIGAWYPAVLNVNDAYMMWYSFAGSDGIGSIYLATSPDGLAWTALPDNPALTPGGEGEWDGEAVFEPSVYFDGRVFHMWYTGSSGPFIERIGYATSP